MPRFSSLRWRGLGLRRRWPFLRRRWSCRVGRRWGRARTRWRGWGFGASAASLVVWLGAGADADGAAAADGLLGWGVEAYPGCVDAGGEWQVGAGADEEFVVAVVPGCWFPVVFGGFAGCDDCDLAGDGG